MDKLQEIKNQLARVDEGVWEPLDNCPKCKGKGHILMDTEAGREFDECHCLIPGDREFNANAPEYITYILQVVEEQKQALEAAKVYLESSSSWNQRKYDVFHKIEQALGEE